ncbi:hypothetical protein PFNF135_06160 [Plasmodium falciparum NF135/5.C10]|uniref:Uncharacterized protein n=1 Tax=Plasmodium falciparum NF135/5.C10 TaxID=1036726 RepID=W4I8T6_PLAFA|nr:hypothetical protein PFNF135_06160 [Plasmodium falciparum NF135/5.C10]
MWYHHEPVFIQHLVLGKSNTCDKTPLVWYNHHMCCITTYVWYDHHLCGMTTYVVASRTSVYPTLGFR